MKVIRMNLEERNGKLICTIDRYLYLTDKGVVNLINNKPELFGPRVQELPKPETLVHYMNGYIAGMNAIKEFARVSKNYANKLVYIQIKDIGNLGKEYCIHRFALTEYRFIEFLKNAPTYGYQIKIKRLRKGLTLTDEDAFKYNQDYLKETRLVHVPSMQVS